MLPITFRTNSPLALSQLRVRRPPLPNIAWHWYWHLAKLCAPLDLKPSPLPPRPSFTFIPLYHCRPKLYQQHIFDEQAIHRWNQKDWRQSLTLGSFTPQSATSGRGLILRQRTTRVETLSRQYTNKTTFIRHLQIERYRSQLQRLLRICRQPRASPECHTTGIAAQLSTCKSSSTISTLWLRRRTRRTSTAILTMT